MKTSIMHRGKTYDVDTSNFLDLAIPYDFVGPQPNFYDVSPGKSTPLKFNETSYAVREGAGCNVSEIKINIHCTGTHTECVGHLLDQNSSVSECVQDILIPTVLMTVQPTSFSSCQESYHMDVQENEKIISMRSLQKTYEKFQDYNPSSMIIRTLPNPEEKRYYRYSDKIPPFFTNDAISFLFSQSIQHLVVDIPSIDRMEDNGILGNHRIFWGDGKNYDTNINPNSLNTITELAYIQNEVNDGFYFLNIQLPRFKCDAAPSRPLLMRIN